MEYHLAANRSVAMRTHQASQKQSSASHPLVSHPFSVQPEPKENTESSGTQGYESQMPEFSTFNPDGVQAMPVQPKLAISAPGDKYEQEADRTAKLVVQRINAPAIARSTPELSIQRQGGIEGGEASTDLESAITSARGRGQPLDAGLQAKMSTEMGADFSGVRVHTDAQSDQLNRSIQARAFTTGQDVFFRQGEYQPGSRGGQELIAHELTHVVQQTSSLQRQENPQLSIQQQPDLAQTIETAALIVEDSITDMCPGQMKKTEFLKHLYQTLYNVGTQEYQGTNLTVTGCPYIVYWFDHYGGEDSKHIERALRKYVSAPPAIATSEELIDLICVRARKGFQEQVKTGKITELPEDVPEQVGDDIVPEPEMIVQRQIEGIQKKPELVIKNQVAEQWITSNVNHNFIQRGCVTGKGAEVPQTNLEVPERNDEEFTDRGGAKKQDKTWVKGVTTQKLKFIHCGSAPFMSQGGSGLDPSYGKEDIKVPNVENAPKKYVLAFPYNGDAGNVLTASKPLQNMWSAEERPHAFIFEVPGGTEIYSDQGGNPRQGMETGFPFLIDQSMLVAEYELQAVRTQGKTPKDKNTYHRVWPEPEPEPKND